MRAWVRYSLIIALITASSLFTFLASGLRESLALFDAIGSLALGQDRLSAGPYLIDANWIGSKLFYLSKLLVNFMILILIFGKTKIKTILLVLVVALGLMLILSLIAKVTGNTNFGLTAYQMGFWITAPYMPLIVIPIFFYLKHDQSSANKKSA